METVSTSVVVCGAGPVGLTLAHLLGMEGIDVILLDRLESTVAEPRAIAFDSESLRTLQKLGLVQEFESELLSGIVADYVNGKGEHLFRIGRPGFRPFGFETVNAFDQPALDRFLAQRLADWPTVDLRFNHQLTRCEQSESGVRVFCTTPEHGELEITADFLVACDGGRSTVRSLLNIAMNGESNPQPWLVIDTRDPYLDGRLDCRFYCDPKRPGMTIRKRHGERRWEWMLMPGEERADLLDEEKIHALIAPYTDISQVTVYRKRVYDFHALIAERWREGRVFLAGDAAHMTPPFAGQGLNSGIRDVTNLSWKLAMVLKGQSSMAILESYEKDRRDHARELIETALALGNQIQPIDEVQAAERDAFFAQLQEDPAALAAMEDDLARSVLERHVDASLVIDGKASSVAGKLLIQPALRAAEGRVLLDEHLGSGFAILGFNCDPCAVVTEQTTALWCGLAAKIVRIQSAQDESTKVDLIDDNNELRDWLGSAAPAVMLVRPDRFCMVYATPPEAEAHLRSAYELLTAG